MLAHCLAGHSWLGGGGGGGWREGGRRGEGGGGREEGGGRRGEGGGGREEGGGRRGEGEGRGGRGDRREGRERNNSKKLMHKCVSVSCRLLKSQSHTYHGTEGPRRWVGEHACSLQEDWKSCTELEWSCCNRASIRPEQELSLPNTSTICKKTIQWDT